MSDWHVNEGLAPLVAEMRDEYPGIVIGTIGDAAHRKEKSDHNPNAAGRVNAADFMLGPAFTEQQALELLPYLVGDPRTRYTIHDRKIWTSETGRWKPYDGTDPHTNHIHQSVKDSAHTDTREWDIPMALTAADKSWIQAQIANQFAANAKVYVQALLNTRLTDPNSPVDPETGNHGMKAISSILAYRDYVDVGQADRVITEVDEQAARVVEEIDAKIIAALGAK